MSARKQPTPPPGGAAKPKPPPPPPRPIEEYPDPLLLSEAAALLRCSVAHVRKLGADGLRVVTWGVNSRVHRVYRADLEKYIESKRNQ